MKVKEEQHGAVWVVRPEGPIAGEDVDSFRQRLLDRMAGSLGRCIIDASEVPFVDSKGLESLVEANDEVNANGQVLKLCGVTETVRRVLDLTKLASRFEYFADVNTAVRSYL